MLTTENYEEKYISFLHHWNDVLKTHEEVVSEQNKKLKCCTEKYTFIKANFVNTLGMVWLKPPKLRRL